jgi:multiple sugar transport system permease protein
MATATITPAQPKTPKSLRAGEGRRGMLLVAPTLVLLAVVILYPLIRAVVLSFQKDQTLVGGFFQQGGAAGLDNYRHWLLQQCQTAGGGWESCPPGTIGNQFWGAFGVTVFWTVVSVGIEVILGLWFATIMNREFRGRGLVRAAILIPWAIPTAVTAKLWFFIYAYDGILNKILGVFGIPPQLWTSDTWPARFGVIMADVWKTTPFMALLILAGLQLISKDVYEAAEVDGATRWQIFVRITLPLIKVPLMVAVLFRVLDVMRIFDLPYIMTGGANGTTSLSILVVKQIQQGFNSASALSTIVFIIIALTAFIFVKFLGADVIQRPPGQTKRKWFRRRPDVEAPEGAEA